MKGGDLNQATKEMISPGKVVSPGLRMNGTYAGEKGFSLAFHPESVTVGCGDAERALEYSVQRSANQVLLQIRDANPISLQLRTDGSIEGEGTVQVNGRVITGTTDDINNPFLFAPNVRRCPLGRLIAAGTSANTASATTTSAPTNSAPANSAPANSAPANPSSATGRPASRGSLTIKSGADVANLLAGKALTILKESLEDALASAGVNAQGGTNRISVWVHACERSTREAVCQQGVSSVNNYIVAKTGFDQSGTAIFNNVPASGSFYVVADTSFAKHLIWNVRVDLRPGPNSVTLDNTNITPISR
jgi:hypothetical protein